MKRHDGMIDGKFICLAEKSASGLVHLHSLGDLLHQAALLKRCMKSQEGRRELAPRLSPKFECSMNEFPTIGSRAGRIDGSFTIVMLAPLPWALNEFRNGRG